MTIAADAAYWASQTEAARVLAQIKYTGAREEECRANMLALAYHARELFPTVMFIYMSRDENGTMVSGAVWDNDGMELRPEEGWDDEGRPALLTPDLDSTWHPFCYDYSAGAWVLLLQDVIDGIALPV